MNANCTLFIMHMIFTMCVYGKMFNELPGFLCLLFEARQAYTSESCVQPFLLVFNGSGEGTHRVILPELNPIRPRRKHLVSRFFLLHHTPGW